METEIRLTRGIYIAAYVLLGYGVAVLGPPAWVLTAVVLTGGDGLSELQALASFGATWGPVICGFVAIGGGISSSGGLTTGGTGRGTGWSRDKISPAFAGGGRVDCRCHAFWATGMRGIVQSVGISDLAGSE